MPIDLPQLTGAHTGERLDEVVTLTLTTYGITADNVGYFVLDNASNNDTTVAALARHFNFTTAHRRLRCGPHTLNLIGQIIIFGSDQAAYDNTAGVTTSVEEEQQFLAQWRREGPLGILIAIINYIKTPQQYDLFASFQKTAADEVPLELRHKLLEPTTTSADGLTLGRNNNRPHAPAWMRSTGLSAADWAVITEYIDLLKPLKVSTERLEGRGKSGKYGAIYEIIPVFEYLLGALESRYRQYEHVNFDAHHEAPEDHLAINLKAAWVKANSYYLKLDNSLNSWADQEGWIETNEAALKQLWGKFKPPRASTARARPHKQDDINDTINAIADHYANKDDELDELEQWRKCEPQWTDTQFQKSNVVRY
ncbi:hypothetical protein L13192_10747 [Pyrenophora tritici-repentis]|nr:hypothetical protein L13192_10747 [Pyrenophora tritici-repentis]